MSTSRAKPKHRKNGTFKVSKKGKYNAKGMRIDGIFFHSQAEAVRYLQLIALQKQGKIRRLELQPKFPIVVKGSPICEFRADFRYEVMSPIGSLLAVLVEDVKGMVLDVYVIKKKLAEACHGIRVYELPARNVQSYAGLRANEILK